MPRPLLPKTFLDDEPLQVEVADEGIVLSIPYIHETTGDTKFKVKTCAGVGELGFYLEGVVKEIRALREQEAMTE